MQKDDIFTKTSFEYIWETCFSSYAREGLIWRERSLMNIAMLIALGRGPELRIHLRAAVNNGLKEEEICEAIRHAMIYCGVPAGRDAMIIASDVFAQLRSSGENPPDKSNTQQGGKK
jgi:4-carboxymuconolactone decarboxylase